MKMTLKRFIRIALFAPVLPILGAGNPPASSEGDPPPVSAPAPDTGKTFSQEEVNHMMAAEKTQGKKSILKSLGFEDEKSLAEKWAEYKALEDGQKTELEKAQGNLKDATGKLTAAEQRAQAAERKISALTAGVKTEVLEEVTALATLKVTETVTFEDALKLVKEKMPTFFGEDTGEGDDGTGTAQGHKRQSTTKEKVGTLGARLAQTKSSETKNPYFQTN